MPISEFHSVMSELLHKRMLTLIVELEDVKSANKALSRRLEAIENENKKLKDMVNSLQRSDPVVPEMLVHPNAASTSPRPDDLALLVYMWLKSLKKRV